MIKKKDPTSKNKQQETTMTHHEDKHGISRGIQKLTKNHIGGSFQARFFTKTPPGLQ